MSDPQDRTRLRLEFPNLLAHLVLMERRSLLSRVSLSTFWVLIAIIMICVSIEITLQGADFGFWGSPRWRGFAYHYGGFWRGLLDNWQPNYRSQPAVMFASYGFLHGGFVHLLVNMITLASLGQLVIERVGQLCFAVIYVLSLLGGAFGFALLSTAVQPMVGASGALFGLAGVLTGWEYTTRRRAREGIGPVLRVVSLLTLLNVIMYWAMDGRLAWETHLGGFFTGWVSASLMRSHLSK